MWIQNQYRLTVPFPDFAQEIFLQYSHLFDPVWIQLLLLTHMCIKQGTQTEHLVLLDQIMDLMNSLIACHFIPNPVTCNNQETILYL